MSHEVIVYDDAAKEHPVLAAYLQARSHFQKSIAQATKRLAQEIAAYEKELP